jgi:hypothetical protein
MACASSTLFVGTYDDETISESAAKRREKELASRRNISPYLKTTLA